MDLKIEKVEELAKLSIAETEKEEFGNELNQVLGFFNQIKAANTNSNLEPLFNPNQEEFEGREDEVIAFEEAPDALLSNAPDKLGRLFKTPPIV